jgi:WhiB family redox-sensing transcriptional regulator
MSNWKKRGACHGYPTEMFHPEDPNQYRHAVAICERCVVKTRCLEFALQTPGPADRFGVYGGLTPPQRRRLRLDLQEAASQEPDPKYKPTAIEWDADAGIYREVKS